MVEQTYVPTRTRSSARAVRRSCIRACIWLFQPDTSA
nr:MAG TPA: hypothetical protein [Caudoviricetes sp.]DAH53846.1 MAG TPA: hypothetical protein [Caudoviricetes sp.]